jgi:putative membrane protein
MATVDLAVPHGIHPLTLVLTPARVLQGWLIPLVVAFALGRAQEGLAAGVFFVVVAIVYSSINELGEMIRLRWWVSDGAFEFRTGILRLETSSIPVARIHNVDVVQPLLPRLLGLAEVRIDTPGAAGAEVELRYVSLPEAMALRDHLASVAPIGETDTLLVSASLGELVLAGATATRLGAFVVLGWAVLGWADNLGIDLGTLGKTFAAGVGSNVSNAVTVGFAIAAVAVLVGWLASIVGTVAKYHDFRLTESVGELRREHGLLTRSSGVIPIARIQAIRIDRPWLRRMVGRATIVADTAGSAVAGSETGTGMLAPIIKEPRVDALIGRVLGIKGPYESELWRVSRLSVRRGFAKAMGVVALCTLLLTMFVPWGSWLGVPGAFASWGWARLRHRAIGYRVEQTLLVSRSGLLVRRTWLVPTDKIQSVAIRRSPFQRRLGLASVSVDTAGPGRRRIVIHDIEDGVADTIADALSTWSSQMAFSADGV